MNPEFTHQSLPVKPRRFISREEVERRVNLKKSAIYQRMKGGTFPQRYANGWLESDIEEYIDQVIASGNVTDDIDSDNG